MIAYDRALQLIQNSFSSLGRSGLIDEEVAVRADTVLLGPGSPLDSIGFVAFVTDLEDRLNRETRHDIVLRLNAIHDFNADNPALSVDTLARYIGQLTAA